MAREMDILMGVQRFENAAVRAMLQAHLTQSALN